MDANIVLVAVTGLLGSVITAVASIAVIMIKSNQVKEEVAGQRVVLDETHKAVNSNFESLRTELNHALKQLAEAQTRIAASEAEKMIHDAVNIALETRHSGERS